MSTVALTATSCDIKSLTNEWEEISKVEDRRSAVVKKILASLEDQAERTRALESQIEFKQLACQQLLEQRHALTIQKDELERKVMDQQEVQSNASFVLVLVDGDGTQFQDSYVTAGTEGGHRAAHGFNQALERFMKDKLGLNSSTNLVIRIYFNAVGLKSAYLRAGILLQKSQLWDFVSGFNRELPLAEYIDAGQDREAADNKIKRNITLNWKNDNCKHIILACSADQGYVNFLRQYSNKSEDRARLTLIEATPFPQSFQQLSTKFGNEPFKELFRDTKIDSLKASPPVRIAQTYASTAAESATLTTSARPETTSSVRAPAPGQRLIPFNQHNQRIDRPLKLPFNGSMIPVMVSRNLCARHHLTQCQRSDCGYSHGSKIDEEERRVLARIARGVVCESGSSCMDRDCVSGHHCLYDKTCNFGAGCKFDASMHNMDKLVAREV